MDSATITSLEAGNLSLAVGPKLDNVGFEEGRNPG